MPAKAASRWAKNLRVAVKETPKGIVFLHAIEPGAASKSYGIEVARLAGLPLSVIERARQVLVQHEQSEKRNVARETEAPLQLTMFTPLSQRILDRLEQTDTNSLTPLQALNLLEELKNAVTLPSFPKAVWYFTRIPDYRAKVVLGSPDNFRVFARIHWAKGWFRVGLKDVGNYKVKKQADINDELCKAIAKAYQKAEQYLQRGK